MVQPSIVIFLNVYCSELSPKSQVDVKIVQFKYSDLADKKICSSKVSLE